MWQENETSIAHFKMALGVRVQFGDFTEDEVVNLYTSETKDLEFVWQEQLHMTAPTGQVIGKQSTGGNFLGTPLLYPEKQRNSPGILSPNIPPNPPSTPVEELPAGGGREGGRSPTVRWNVNAMPFIPANVSVISPAKNNFEASKGQLDYHSVSNKLDRLAHRSDVQERLSSATENNRDIKSHVTATRERLNDTVQTVGLSTSGSSTSAVPGESSAQERSDLQARTDTDVSDSHSNGSSIPHVASSEEVPLIQVQSETSTGINGRSTSQNTSLSDTPPSDQQSAAVLSSQSSSSKAQSKSNQTQQQENTNLQRTSEISTRSQESSPHPSHTPSPHPHTITPPPPHTLTHQPITDVTTSRTQPSPTSSEGHTSSSRSASLTSPTPTSTPSTPKPKSWASIVGRSTTPTASPTGGPASIPPGQPASSSAQSSSASKSGNGQPEEQAVDPIVSNAILKRLGEKLNTWKMSHSPVDIQPRGLINQGNWCYMHAPLQALLSCPGMYHLCKSLDPNPPLTKDPSPTPITDTMAQFFHEFKPYPSTAPPPPTPTSSAKKKRSSHRPELLSGDPFRPDYVYGMLQKIKSHLSYKGRQEDAEEFLGCVLDRMHTEMVSARKVFAEEVKEEDIPSSEPSTAQASAATKDEDEEWEQVGPKNKSTITRQTTFSESPITKIFGGELRSAVHRQGAKESATVEPFFSLQLDIQNEDIWTVKDALESLAVKETVHMSEVEAQRRITLAHLPSVLILHLKRFIFNLTGGSQKLQKHIQYSIDLEISKDLLAPAIKNKLALSQRSYKLWAVVYHHGKTATGGHYTCDTHHPVCGGWVRTDDSNLKLVPEEHVLKPPANQSNKVAYLLFYRRLDTLRI